MTDSNDFRPGAGRILVVCTGNVCRSPYLERRLRSELRGTGIAVTSAGTGALAGHEMEPMAAERLSLAGGDPEGFRARQVTAQMVRNVDLVLCATREHRTTIVRLEPKALRRTFAVLDFSDLAEHIPPGPPEPSFLDEPDANFVQRVVSAGTLHRDEVHARIDGDADVIDPFQRGEREFDKMAEQLESAIVPIVRVLRTILTLESAD
ncbi:low molecular weight phosphatase family protein [Leekyejoonella antrihumi]|nr:low molecular weight phosphatase family protein [Leekyejoonella antrihumi]